MQCATHAQQDARMMLTFFRMQELFRKATSALDEGRSTLGDGSGFGPGATVTFTGPNGISFTMGKNERCLFSPLSTNITSESRPILPKSPAQLSEKWLHCLL